MSCKYGVFSNGRERVRTLPTLAMQKVVGSSPIIRSKALQKAIFSFHI